MNLDVPECFPERLFLSIKHFEIMRARDLDIREFLSLILSFFSECVNNFNPIGEKKLAKWKVEDILQVF